MFHNENGTPWRSRRWPPGPVTLDRRGGGGVWEKKFEGRARPNPLNRNGCVEGMTQGVYSNKSFWDVTFRVYQSEAESRNVIIIKKFKDLILSNVSELHKSVIFYRH